MAQGWPCKPCTLTLALCLGLGLVEERVELKTAQGLTSGVPSVAEPRKSGSSRKARSQRGSRRLGLNIDGEAPSCWFDHLLDRLRGKRVVNRTAAGRLFPECTIFSAHPSLVPSLSLAQQLHVLSYRDKYELPVKRDKTCRALKPVPSICNLARQVPFVPGSGGSFRAGGARLGQRKGSD